MASKFALLTRCSSEFRILSVSERLCNGRPEGPSPRSRYEFARRTRSVGEANSGGRRMTDARPRWQNGAMTAVPYGRRATDLAAAAPDAPAFVFEGRVLTRRALESDANRLARDFE